MKIDDAVQHKDYPGTTGKVVAKHGDIILVLWDRNREPGSNLDGEMDLKSRCSRHISWALRHVAT